VSGDRKNDTVELDPTLPSTPSPEDWLPGGKLTAGTVVGSYVIEKQCARGGFGTVYRAHCNQRDAPVALKVLHQDLVFSRVMVRRFEREARTVSRLRHANIVRVLELGELGDGRPFIAMEWLDGRTLQEELNSRGPLALAEAMAVMEDLCAALQAAHALGVVHRDLKASNVMTTPAGEWFVVRLFDFGVAKLLEPENPDETGLTSTGTRVGTPHNMAPEQITGAAIDVRTDVYALGVLLFQLLTGRYPFEAKNWLEIEDMHMHSPPPRASDSAAVPPAIDAVIGRCLQKEPSDRYPSIGEALEELRAASADGGGQEPSWAQELRPSARWKASSTPAVGVCATVRAACDDEEIDDDLFDAMDDALAAVADQLAESGMDIAQESGSSLLAIAALDEGASSETLRQEVVEGAAKLWTDLASAGETDSRLQLALVVHLADVVYLVEEGKKSYISGDLLNLSTWTADAPAHGVFVTRGVIQDLETTLAEEPIAEAATLIRVTARR